MQVQKIANTHEVPYLEADVDEAIRLAGGDPRAAIRGLIMGQRQIEAELGARISAGYVRGRR